MANGWEAIGAMIQSAGSVANTYNQYLTDEAKLSTQNKQIQLKDDINKEMMKIQSSSNSDQWETNINGFFEKLKGEMNNPNSKYYCKNNLQGRMFTQIVDEAQVDVSNKVGQLVWNADREKAIVDYRNNLTLLAQNETGQNYIDKANELAKSLFDCGYITREQYQNQLDTNFDTAYINTATKAFDDTFVDAVKRGESEDTFINMVLDNVTPLIGIDTDGLPKTFDKEAMNDTLRKNFKSKYRAKQQDIWDQTEKQCAQIYDSIMDQRTAEGRNSQRMAGRAYLDAVKDTGLISADQLTKWTARFALEDYYSPEGTTTSSQRKSAASKMDPQDYIDFYMNAIKNGDTTTVYNAWKDFQDDILAEYREVTGNYNASIVDVEKAFPKVGKFLEYASKNLPPDFQDVVNYAENVIKTTLNTKDDKSKYEEELNSTLDVVKDILFDMDIKNAGPDAKKEIKARVTRTINANLGGVLEKQKDYKEYFGKDYEGIKTLSDYREGVIESKEARMAKAMQERDANPDLVYTKANGVEVPYALQEGLARLENDERSEIKQLIKSQTGKDISDAEIDMHYESDGRNDVTARRRYTIDGVDYRFRTEDGKHIIMEKKKNGTAGSWEQVRTVTQQNEYDSPKAVAKRTKEEVTGIVNKTNWKNTSIPAGGFTYIDENGKEQKLTYTDPEGEEKVINQTYWKYLRANEKTRIILEWMEKEPEAAKAWLDKLEAK